VGLGADLDKRILLLLGRITPLFLARDKLDWYYIHDKDTAA